MKCPSCNGNLKEVKLGDFFVNGCKPCDGLWLKKFDVNPILKYLVELKNKGKNFQSISPAENELLNGQKGRYCPDCGNPTETFEWGESEVVSFACRENCGAWVRMKQLEKICEWYETHVGLTKNYRFFKIKEKEELISGETTFLKGFVGWMSDDIITVATPAITFTLIALNIICFALSFMLSQTEFKNLCMIPAKIIADPIANSYLLVTNIFLHASLGHLFGNMFFLYLFGKSLEDRVGKIKFILMYLLAGIVASIAHAGLTNYPNIPALGASGAVSGIMGAYLILFPKAKISFHKTIFWKPFKIVLPAWFYLGFWFVGQQILGIALNAGGIAWYAHFFGFVFGAIVILLLKILRSL